MTEQLDHACDTLHRLQALFDSIATGSPAHSRLAALAEIGSEIAAREAEDLLLAAESAAA
ncbi:hypothetical protein [Modicisalibacter xianhensis]|uniref:Uncharacterized protein n=1 Tax=Modicisalibacter xianhensis TaxID=442341 RepID=A0A1I3GAL1_9GAMM|nr:hypothetical protein [Halomonas xianhensis]SFI20575.1 hypothetical protein SAMN04487959_1296 [Halomonas xianhensis]